MPDFFDLNLWMFIVIGALGYLLCCFRYRFLWIVLPTVVLVCIGYLITSIQSNLGSVSFDGLTIMSVGFSMFFALALPIAGAIADHRDRFPRKSKLP